MDSSLFLSSFHRIPFEASQDECPDPTQTPRPGWNAPDPGRCLGQFCSGVSAHGALPISSWTPSMGDTSKTPKGHGASLTLCLPASGGLIDLPHVWPLQAVLEALDVLLVRIVPGESDPR